MSPSAAKVALGRKTSGLRVSWSGSVAVGADVKGAIFTIVTCTMAPKAFGQSRSGATGDWDVKEASGSREDWTIIAELYHERTVCVDSILIQTVFRVNSGERRRGIGQSGGRDACEQRCGRRTRWGNRDGRRSSVRREFRLSEVMITMFHSHGQKNAAKSRVNSCRRNLCDERVEAVKMKNR